MTSRAFSGLARFLTPENNPLDAPEARDEARKLVRSGILLVLALLATFVFWSVIASIEGAVIAQGTLVVDANAKKIQHQEGGIVRAVKVKDGDRVQAGQVLLELDDTTARSTLSIVENQLVDMMARRARLRAEMAGSDQIGPINWPLRAELEEQRTIVLAAEKALLAARTLAQKSRMGQLEEKKAQIVPLLDGLKAQRSAKDEEVLLIDRELKGIKELFAKGLASIQRMSALERERSRLFGERGRIVAEEAKTRGMVAEVEIQAAELEEKYRSDLLTERRQVEARIVELEEKRTTSEDRLNRTQITSPTRELSTIVPFIPWAVSSRHPKRSC